MLTKRKVATGFERKMKLLSKPQYVLRWNFLPGASRFQTWQNLIVSQMKLKANKKFWLAFVRLVHKNFFCAVELQIEQLIFILDWRFIRLLTFLWYHEINEKLLSISYCIACVLSQLSSITLHQHCYDQNTWDFMLCIRRNFPKTNKVITKKPWS